MLKLMQTSLRTGNVTNSYPKRSEFSACRGRPILDSSRCTGSGDCLRVCPSHAITETQVEPGSRVWRLDLARCLFCGLCAEACPHVAITMSHGYELAARKREDLVCEVVQTGAFSTNVEAALAVGANTHVAPTESKDEAGGCPVNILPRQAEKDLDELNRRIRGHLKRSLHIRHMAAGSENSCDWEISALLNPVYDVQRLGIDFVASPRHADLLLVTGAVTRHLEPALLATYEAMPSPRLVVAVGDEACSGGILRGSYACAGGVDRCLPVDVYIPGDPPSPLALIHGLLMAVDRRESRL